MHNLSVADVDSHMAGIADDVSGLCILQAVHPISLGTIRCRGMGQADTEIRIDAHDEAGTVSAVGKAAAAIDIRIADELQSEIEVFTI